MKELTSRELHILEILWDLKKGFVNDVIDRLNDPKPPYTTVSSIVRILETKGYVSHKAYGKTYEYQPVVSRLAYKKFALKNLITGFFDGSLENVVSFMAEEKELSQNEINELSELIDHYKKKGNE